MEESVSTLPGTLQVFNAGIYWLELKIKIPSKFQYKLTIANKIQWFKLTFAGNGQFLLWADHCILYIWLEVLKSLELGEEPKGR